MLERLIGSKIRIKILKLLLMNEQTRFSLEEIFRNLKTALKSTKSELENLEKLGIVIRSDKKDFNPGNKEVAKKRSSKGGKFFFANRDFVLFHEVKALLVKSQILYEKDFIDQVRRLGKIKLLVLSGVFVGRENSIVDILVVGRFNRRKMVKLISDLERDLGREINYTFLDVNEFKYRRNITDVFIYEILESKNLVLIDDLDNRII